KRAQVWAETNEKIREENQRQVEQLGSDLESVFDDISSGNIGTRILNNMKKLFFQILAQWIITMKSMSNGASSILGTIGTLLLGPGSQSAGILSSGGGGFLGMGAPVSAGVAGSAGATGG